MNVLVTGGAGYIGSHVVRELVRCGHEVTVLDNLSHGHRAAVHNEALFVAGDIAQSTLVARVLTERQIEAVLHFAGFIEVGESVTNPGLYYFNNFANTLTLLEVMRACNVKRIVFSSTAAVYGSPLQVPIEEDHPLQPLNPYGASKMMVEMALHDFAKAHQLAFTILRYFNVAGASEDASIGEAHEPESHLIPRVLASCANPSQPVYIYGTNYPTKDGTCVRDYVHVEDLSHAHVLALQNLHSGAGEVFNVGSESGFTVREVIQACEEVTGRAVGLEERPKRAGDPTTLVASSRKIRALLNWSPRFPDLKTMIRHAWQWHSSRPNGYRPAPLPLKGSFRTQGTESTVLSP